MLYSILILVGLNRTWTGLQIVTGVPPAALRHKSVFHKLLDMLQYAQYFYLYFQESTYVVLQLVWKQL